MVVYLLTRKNSQAIYFSSCHKIIPGVWQRYRKFSKTAKAADSLMIPDLYFPVKNFASIPKYPMNTSLYEDILKK